MSEKSPTSRQELANNTGMSYLEALKLSQTEVEDRLDEQAADIAEAHGVFTGIDYAQALQENATYKATIPVAETKTEAISDLDQVGSEEGLENDATLTLKMRDRLNLHLLTASQKLVEISRKSKDKAGKNWIDSKEALRQRRPVLSLLLGGRACAGYLGIGTTLILASKTANATGVTADLLHGAESFMGIPLDQSTASGGGNAHHDTYNTHESHSHDRMSTEGAFDGTERGPINMDQHVLDKIKNNPSLMASVLEVRESGHMDKNFSLKEVNHDTHSYTVSGENGTFSSKGHAAVDTLDRSWGGGNQGKLLSKNEVHKMLESHMLINHGTDEGRFENARDDTTYRAGTFDYRPELGDKIYSKELGNGKTVFFKVNEQDPSRDCLNVLTLADKQVPIVAIPTETAQTQTPVMENREETITFVTDHTKTHREHPTTTPTPTPDTTPTPTPTPDTTPTPTPTPDTTPTPTPAKGPTFGSDGSDVKLDKPEAQQTPGAGNNTNIDTTRTPDSAANGSGSSDLAEGATPVADRSPEVVKDVPSVKDAGTAATNNTDPGAPK